MERKRPYFPVITAVLIALLVACRSNRDGPQAAHNLAHPGSALDAESSSEYSSECRSAIVAIEQDAGGRFDGTLFVLASEDDNLVNAWNKRLSDICRASVSIMAGSVARSYGWSSAVLFGALPVQQWRYRQWLQAHPPEEFVDANTGEPILHPAPDHTDTSDLLKAEERLNAIKNGSPLAQKDYYLHPLNFVESSIRKRILIEALQEDLGSMERDLLEMSAHAGVPIRERDLMAWAKSR